MKLEMKMVLLKEKKPHLENGRSAAMEFPYESFQVAVPARFSEKQKRNFQGDDPVLCGKSFSTQTHFRIQKRQYIPSFWVTCDAEDDPPLTDVRVYYSLPDDSEHRHPMAALHGEAGAFIDVPTGRYRDGFFNYDSDEARGSLGSVQPGVTDIYLCDRNGDLIPSAPPRRFVALPSSVTVAQLSAMVAEILSIRRELVQLEAKKRKKAKSALLGQSVLRDDSSDFNQMLAEVKACLDAIAPHLRKIDAQPRARLRACTRTASAKHLRKIDQRIVRQYVQNPAREKYVIPDAERTEDLYEHRLIRNKLERLQSYLEQQKTQCTLEMEQAKKNALEDQCVAMREQSGFLEQAIAAEAAGEAGVHRAWRDYRQGREKALLKPAETYGNAFQAYKSVSVQEVQEGIPWLSAELKLDLRSLYFRIEANGDGIYFSAKRKNGTWGKEREAFLCRSEQVGGFVAWHPVLEWNVRIQDSAKLLAIAVVFDRYERQHPGTMVHVRCFGRGIFLNSGNGYQEIDTYELQTLSIGGQSYNFAKQLNHSSWGLLRKYYIRQRLMESNESDIIKWNASCQLEKRWQAAANEVDADAYNRLKGSLDSLLALPFLKRTRQQDEAWRMTQIFTNDPHYHAVYQGLRRLDDTLDFTFDAGRFRLEHRKFDKLYEYWIFCRIIKKLLINEKWNTANGADVIASINEFFRTGKGQVPCVNLTHELPDHHTMHMEFYYERHLRESLAEEIKRGDSSAYEDKESDMELWPDYLFRVWVSDDKSIEGQTEEKQKASLAEAKAETEKIFILDAKYRDYGDMGGIEKLQQADLQEICVDKYIQRPVDRLRITDIRAAFIVHSDAAPEEEAPGVPRNPNKLQGKYVTYDAARDGRFGRFNTEHPRQQVGAFYLVPADDKVRGINRSDINLETFFKLMLEYDMGQEDVCWHCGSTDVDVQVLHTRKGYEKYHMTCRDCKEFWVENHCDQCGATIMKHPFNYFVERNRQTWHLRCPNANCKSNQPKEKQQKTATDMPQEAFEIEQMMREAYNNMWKNGGPLEP